MDGECEDKTMMRPRFNNMVNRHVVFLTSVALVPTGAFMNGLIVGANMVVSSKVARVGMWKDFWWTGAAWRGRSFLGVV